MIRLAPRSPLFPYPTLFRSENPRAWATAPGLPVIITTGGNLQLLAEPQDGMLVFHRVDPFIPFEDGSERMPNVFFKMIDRKSTRLNSSHMSISYAVFCLKKK